MGADLIIKNLHVRVEGQEILKGLDFEMNKGEVHAIMGPNGSGKSTLANTLMGHPAYEVTEGEILFQSGETEAAFVALRRGVALEDALPYDEPPGWMQPVRHALGALLLQEGQIEEAEVERLIAQAQHGRLDAAAQQRIDLAFRVQVVGNFLAVDL